MISCLVARARTRVYLRGWEERQHHSLILRQCCPRPPRRRRPAGLLASGPRRTWTGPPSTSPGQGLTTRWIERRALTLDGALAARLGSVRPFFRWSVFGSIEQFETQHQRFINLRAALRWPRFDHVNLHAPEAWRTRFATATAVLGLRCSEYIYDPTDSRRCTDEADHRRLAPAQADGPRRGADRGHRAAPAPLSPTGSPTPPGVLRACGPARRRLSLARHRALARAAKRASPTRSSSTCTRPRRASHRAPTRVTTTGRPRSPAPALECQRSALPFVFGGAGTRQLVGEESSLLLRPRRGAGGDCSGQRRRARAAASEVLA